MQISGFSRVWRLILGTLLVAWSVAGGPVWAYGGIVFLLSGAFGFSFLRLVFRTRD